MSRDSKHDFPRLEAFMMTLRSIFCERCPDLCSNRKLPTHLQRSPAHIRPTHGAEPHIAGEIISLPDTGQTVFDEETYISSGQGGPGNSEGAFRDMQTPFHKQLIAMYGDKDCIADDHGNAAGWRNVGPLDDGEPEVHDANFNNIDLDRSYWDDESHPAAAAAEALHTDRGHDGQTAYTVSDPQRGEIAEVVLAQKDILPFLSDQDATEAIESFRERACNNNQVPTPKRALTASFSRSACHQPQPTRRVDRPEAFTIMSVPAELRNEFYRKAMVISEHSLKPKFCPSGRSKYASSWSTRVSQDLVNVSLLQTNRTIHLEALHIFWSENTFTICDKTHKSFASDLADKKLHDNRIIRRHRSLINKEIYPRIIDTAKHIMINLDWITFTRLSEVDHVGNFTIRFPRDLEHDVEHKLKHDLVRQLLRPATKRILNCAPSVGLRSFVLNLPRVCHVTDNRQTWFIETAKAAGLIDCLRELADYHTIDVRLGVCDGCQLHHHGPRTYERERSPLKGRIEEEIGRPADFMVLTPKGCTDLWIFDTGATRHIVGDRTLFAAFAALPARVSMIGVGGPFSAIGAGDIKLRCQGGDGNDHELVLYGAFFVPGFRHKLVSAARLRDTGPGHTFRVAESGDIEIGKNRILAVLDQYSTGLYGIAVKEVLDRIPYVKIPFQEGLETFEPEATATLTPFLERGQTFGLKEILQALLAWITRLLFLIFTKTQIRTSPGERSNEVQKAPVKRNEDNSCCGCEQPKRGVASGTSMYRAG